MRVLLAKLWFACRLSSPMVMPSRFSRFSPAVCRPILSLMRPPAGVRVAVARDDADVGRLLHQVQTMQANRLINAILVDDSADSADSADLTDPLSTPAELIRRLNVPVPLRQARHVSDLLFHGPIRTVLVIVTETVLPESFVCSLAEDAARTDKFQVFIIVRNEAHAKCLLRYNNGAKINDYID